LESYSDQELLDLFTDPVQRERAFTLIVEKYQRRLYHHIRRLVISHEDADDVLQNTFVKVWKGLGRFRGGSELFTWLYRIATNEALNFLKRERKNLFRPWEGYERQLEETLESDEHFSGDTILKRLHKALLRLPEKQRLVFNLRYFEGMRYEEMSRILGTTEGALKASYHHAVKKVESYLRED